MWNSILDVLVKKAKDGVDVRVIHDDMGCIAMLPSNYPKTLESIGIKCIASQVVPESELQSKQAKQFGCDVDYNVYTKKANPNRN